MTSSGQPTGEEIVATIRKLGWWQGAVILGSQLPADEDSQLDVKYWVVASQTCNLYNISLESVPRIELVAAICIDSCKPSQTRGDHPRKLHTTATSTTGSICLELDLLRRRWIPRSTLAELEAPEFALRDSRAFGESSHRWLDTFVGWIGRSYTRVTLPDEFNAALKKSKLEDVIKEKLAGRRTAELHGIYLNVERDDDAQWTGELGLMPPPYNLEVTIVTQGNADPEALKNAFLKQVFEDKIIDPDDASKKLTRAKLARRFGIRLIEQGVQARPIDAITLGEIRELTRFSFVDHLSDSADSMGP